MRLTYRSTIYSCFMGYIVQAIINNFIPLLFITLQREFSIPIEKITMLVTFNFGVQLAVDAAAAFFVDRIGYRRAMVAADIFAALGLVLLAVLPDVLHDPFVGILIPVTLYAVGGGLLEVLVSPIMESCPTDNKEKAMSLLHSFYCWGHVAVVLISTLFFAVCGISNWRILAVLWAAVPVVNGIMFTKAPIAPLIAEGEKGLSVRELFSSRTFLVLIIMMICAGASEQSVSQWASAFAEQGLGISKQAGDLAGPLAFAVLMGSSRAFYGKYGDRININVFMTSASLLCIASYLIISLVPSPVISLMGCAVCGLSVGIMWPGTFSKAAASLKNGGTFMFAILALAGDLGCSGGPTLAGFVSGAFGDDLRTGILSAVVFPVVMTVCLLRGRRKESVNNE